LKYLITKLIEANQWISYRLFRLIEDQNFDKNCDLSIKVLNNQSFVIIEVFAIIKVVECNRSNQIVCNRINQNNQTLL